MVYKKGAINSLGSKFYNLFNYKQGGSKFILRMYWPQRVLLDSNASTFDVGQGGSEQFWIDWWWFRAMFILNIYGWIKEGSKVKQTRNCNLS